jgi:hypothetical protein
VTARKEQNIWQQKKDIDQILGIKEAMSDCEERNNRMKTAEEITNKQACPICDGAMIDDMMTYLCPACFLSACEESESKKLTDKQTHHVNKNKI